MNIVVAMRQLEAALGTSEQRSMSEWHVLVQYAARHHACTVTETAWAALLHVGGMSALRSAGPKEQSFLRRDFCEFYCLQHDLGQFDSSPHPLGEYLPVDFPGQPQRLAALPPGPVEAENLKRLAAMISAALDKQEVEPCES